MHYRDGTEAKVGDFVKGKTWDGKLLIGQVQMINPGSTACNMQVTHTVMVPQAQTSTHTVGEFELLHREEPPADA